MTPDERIAAALERIALALEQGVLNQIPEPLTPLPPPQPFDMAAVDAAPLPEPPPEFVFGQRPQPVQGALTAVCPIHRKPWTFKEAGISKAGKPYEGFWKCDERMPDNTFCKQKPARPAA